MWSQASLLPRLVASSVKIAETAGNLIKQIMATGLKVDPKLVKNVDFIKCHLDVVDKGINGIKNLQTKADRCAQIVILSSLEKQFGSELIVVGEEGKLVLEKNNVELSVDENVLNIVHTQLPDIYKSVKIEDFVIWVDPLDGTSEFAAAMHDKSISLDQVTVLIGIAYQGKPISGIIHQPYYNNGVGRTLWGVLGIGSFNYENKVCLSQKIAVTTKSHSTALVDLTLKSLKEKKLIEKVERVGGAGFKVINILEGATAYVFASDGCRKWDTCAPEAVLSAAGGQLTNLSGQNYSYKIDAEHQNHGGVLATGFGTNHQSFIDAIPAQVKETLCKL